MEPMGWWKLSADSRASRDEDSAGAWGHWHNGARTTVTFKGRGTQVDAQVSSVMKILFANFRTCDKFMIEAGTS